MLKQWIFIVGWMCLFFTSILRADSTIHRIYWNPMYHGQRLAYCELGDRRCGVSVATQYCHMMGYKKADQATMAYNLGLTHYIKTDAHCQGWQCHGFKRIDCRGELAHRHPMSYAYRSKLFMIPRWKGYRMAWCDDAHHHCGRAVANSFCQRMAYRQAKKYIKQDHVLATRALWSEKLCFGPMCQGFSSIICYR